MEILKITYTYDYYNNFWNAIVDTYPTITVCRAKDLDTAKHTIYQLLTDEMFHRYKNLNSWSIGIEEIKYL